MSRGELLMRGQDSREDIRKAMDASEMRLGSSRSEVKIMVHREEELFDASVMHSDGAVLARAACQTRGVGHFGRGGHDAGRRALRFMHVSATHASRSVVFVQGASPPAAVEVLAMRSSCRRCMVGSLDYGASRQGIA
eukprot:4807558-Pyramimonas_sp.AAC.1